METNEKEEQEMPTTAESASGRRLLRASEAAAMLGLSRNYMRDLVAEGKLKSVRIGEHGWHRFRVSDVERFLAGEEPERHE